MRAPCKRRALSADRQHRYAWPMNSSMPQWAMRDPSMSATADEPTFDTVEGAPGASETSGGSVVPLVWRVELGPARRRTYLDT